MTSCPVILNSGISHGSVADLQQSLERRKDKHDMTKAMKEILQMGYNGENVTPLIVPIIKNVGSSPYKILKRFLRFFWPMVQMTDTDGKLKQEMLLACNHIAKDLVGANEYLVAQTLRMLTALPVEDLLANIAHVLPTIAYEDDSIIRGDFIVALHSIYKRFPHILPQGPTIVADILRIEKKPDIVRRGLRMLADCDPMLAAEALSFCEALADPSHPSIRLAFIETALAIFSAEEVDVDRHALLAMIEEMARNECSAVDSHEKDKFSPEVLYSLATTLPILAPSSTDVLELTARTWYAVFVTAKVQALAELAFEKIEKLALETGEFGSQIVPFSLIRDMHGATRHRRFGLRRKILELLQHRSDDTNVSFLLDCIITEVGTLCSGQKFDPRVANDLSTLLAMIREMLKTRGGVFVDAVVRSKAFFEKFEHLFSVVTTQVQASEIGCLLTQLATFSDEAASAVCCSVLRVMKNSRMQLTLRHCLWILGEFTTGPNSVKILGSIMEELRPPFVFRTGDVPGEQVSEKDDSAIVQIAEDGTYRMRKASVEEKSKLQELLESKSLFFFSSIAISTTKLYLRAVTDFSNGVDIPHMDLTAARMSLLRLIPNMIQYLVGSSSFAGVSTPVNLPLEAQPVLSGDVQARRPDSLVLKRLGLCIDALLHPCGASANQKIWSELSRQALAVKMQIDGISDACVTVDGTELLDTFKKSVKGVSESTTNEKSEEIRFVSSADEPLDFSCLTGGSAVLPPAVLEDMERDVAVTANLFERVTARNSSQMGIDVADLEELRRLNCVIPLSGQSERIYVEALVSYDGVMVTLTVLLLNRSAEPITNVVLQVPSSSGLTAVSNSGRSLDTIEPFGSIELSRVLHATHGHGGVIHPILCYDVGSVSAGSSKHFWKPLSDIRIDITQFLEKHQSSSQTFSTAWLTAEWEHKVQVRVKKGNWSLPALASEIADRLRFAVCTPLPASDVDFICANLSAETTNRSLALMNLSMELQEDEVVGSLRIRTSHQSLAVNLGEKATDIVAKL